MLKSRLPLVEGEGGDKTRDNTQTHTRASESDVHTAISAEVYVYIH